MVTALFFEVRQQHPNMYLSKCFIHLRKKNKVVTNLKLFFIMAIIENLMGCKQRSSI